MDTNVVLAALIILGTCTAVIAISVVNLYGKVDFIIDDEVKAIKSMMRSDYQNISERLAWVHKNSMTKDAVIAIIDTHPHVWTGQELDERIGRAIMKIVDMEYGEKPVRPGPMRADDI